MRFRFFIVLACACVFVIPAAVRAGATGDFAHLKYRSIGPAISGGRVSAVAGSDRDPMLYYVGSAGGGVFKSVNGGTSFTDVFAKEPIGAIGAIAVSPRDDNDVWVGTGEANPRNDVSYGDGVWRSTDGGKRWRHRGLDEFGDGRANIAAPIDGFDDLGAEAQQIFVAAFPEGDEQCAARRCVDMNPLGHEFADLVAGGDTVARDVLERGGDRSDGIVIGRRRTEASQLTVDSCRESLGAEKVEQVLCAGDEAVREIVVLAEAAFARIDKRRR
jgi:hypothetical protein